MFRKFRRYENATTPALGEAGVVILMRTRCVRGGGSNTCACGYNGAGAHGAIVREDNVRRDTPDAAHHVRMTCPANCRWATWNIGGGILLAVRRG